MTPSKKSWRERSSDSIAAKRSPITPYTLPTAIFSENRRFDLSRVEGLGQSHSTEEALYKILAKLLIGPNNLVFTKKVGGVKVKNLLSICLCSKCQNLQKARNLKITTN